MGMPAADMVTIADFMGCVLANGESSERVGRDVLDFCLPQQTIYYNFD